MATKATYELTCLLRGDHNTFTILIDSTSDVSDLRDLICKNPEKMDVLRGVDPVQLLLSKVCQEYYVIIDLLTEPLVSQVEIDLESLPGHLSTVELNDNYQPFFLDDPSIFMSELWEEQPSRQHIHIYCAGIGRRSW